MYTKLEKPERINSNLVNGGHLSCGVNSIVSILYSLGFKNINLEELNDELIKEDKELEFGGIYNIKKFSETLIKIREKENIDFKFQIEEFKTAEELENIFLRNPESYIMVCYYALQGFVRVTNHPTMEHAHFGVIYDYDEKNRKVYGSQSNGKADKLKCLENIDIDKFFDIF